MNWKPWGKDDMDEITADGEYSIHYAPMGWSAWQRIPMKRIGEIHAERWEAKNACEQHNRARCAA